MSISEKPFEDDGDIQFPVITIAVSLDDLNEPVHVDLGSIPPFVAMAVLEKVLSVLKFSIPAPKVTFKGNVLVEPFSPENINFEEFFGSFIDDDEDTQDDGEDNR